MSECNVYGWSNHRKINDWMNKFQLFEYMAINVSNLFLLKSTKLPRYVLKLTNNFGCTVFGGTESFENQASELRK